MSQRLRLGGLLLLGAVAVWFLYVVRAIIPPFLLAIIIAYFTSPAVRRLEKQQVPRTVSIVLVYLALIIFLSAFVVFIIPLVLEELNDIVANLPAKTRYLQGLTENLFARRARLPAFFRPVVDESIRSLQEHLRIWAGNVAEVVLAFFSRSIFFFLSPFLAFYLTRDAEYIGEKLLTLAPMTWQGDLRRLGTSINEAIEGYISGQLVVGMMVGGIIAVGLVFLGIPYALAIGLLAGLLDLIPYFGPAISAIPAVILALGISPWKVVYVVLVYFAAHQMEGAVLSPRVVGDRVGLHPVAVIFALLAGEQVLGFLGMLMAVPVAAVIKVVGSFLLEKLIVTRPID